MTTNANATEAVKKFEGYQTKIDGKAAWVVNANETHLKVIFGRVIGYDGWSGGSRPIYSFYGKKVWVPKTSR